MKYLKKVVSAMRAEILDPSDFIAQNEGPAEGVLYITDSSVIAKELMERQCAVLVVLHSENREEDFHFCRYACEKIEELDMEYLEGIYRRQKGIAWDILETERCLIRETTVEDVEAFYRIYGDASITEFMEPLFSHPDEERQYAKDYIDQVYAFYNFGIWSVVLRETGEVIGRAGICYREGYDIPELGFMIAREHQGRGLATEICRAILGYADAQLGFDCILAFVRPGNSVSEHVCQKIGMQRWKEEEGYIIYRIG